MNTFDATLIATHRQFPVGCVWVCIGGDIGEVPMPFAARGALAQAIAAVATMVAQRVLERFGIPEEIEWSRDGRWSNDSWNEVPVGEHWNWRTNSCHGAILPFPVGS